MRFRRITKSVGWLALLLALAAPAQAATPCRVLEVPDGDSLTVHCGARPLRLRLAQIDAPEYRQQHGRSAREALQRLVRPGIAVDVLGEDDYGRRLALVYAGGELINRRLVREGHAWVYRRYLQDPSWLADERYAREHRLGLWQQRRPMPPWRFRAQARKSGHTAWTGNGGEDLESGHEHIIWK